MTSVCTAFSTSLAARSLRGLKFCFRSSANSSASAGAGATVVADSVPVARPSWIPLFRLLGRALARRLLFELRLHRRHQFRIGEQFLERVFRARPCRPCSAADSTVARAPGGAWPSPAPDGRSRRATKSSILANFRLTESFSPPSAAPSLLGTFIDTAGSIAAMRLSKLSMSMSRNLRSFMSGLATCDALPGEIGEHAHHERQLDQLLRRRKGLRR